MLIFNTLNEVFFVVVAHFVQLEFLFSLNIVWKTFHKYMQRNTSYTLSICIIATQKNK